MKHGSKALKDDIAVMVLLRLNVELSIMTVDLSIMTLQDTIHRVKPSMGDSLILTSL